MNYLANLTRPAGDPVIRSSGPSSLAGVDRLGRALGWFSIGLGALEVLAPRAMARALGMRGRHRLLRSYGAREIGAGVLALSVDKQVGLWGRVVGDALDVATLAGALRADNPKRATVKFALTLVAGITLLDVCVAQAVTTRHARGGAARRYSDRSGFPRGLQATRQAATSSGTNAPEAVAS